MPEIDIAEYDSLEAVLEVVSDGERKTIVSELDKDGLRSMKTEEALKIVAALREEVLHDIFLTQALLCNTLRADVEGLKRIVQHSRTLRSNRQLPNDRAAHQHIKDVQRSLTRKTKPKLRAAAGRVFKVKP